MKPLKGHCRWSRKKKKKKTLKRIESSQKHTAIATLNDNSLYITKQID